MTKEEVTKIIENTKTPKGVIAQGANGQLFFLSHEDAERWAIPSSTQYSDLLSAILKKTHLPAGARERLTQQSCDNIADWLTSHSPNTHPEWMGVAGYYLDHC